MRLADYVVVWTDNVRETNRSAEEAEAHGGELLAAGGLHDALAGGRLGSAWPGFAVVVEIDQT